MSHPLEPQVDEHGDRLPPGTFLLVRPGQTSQRKEDVILEPQPDANPNNPLNWSSWRKTYNFGLILANTVVIFTALSIQINYWGLMVLDMNVTLQQLNNAVSVNFVGLSLGCVFCIPFSKKYGRRSTYVLSTAVMAASLWWSAEMTTATELYLTNLISGLAGATNETIALMTVADLFFVHQRGTMNALYIIAVMIGSFLTVIPAGVQAVNQGWRVSYMTLAGFDTFLSILYLISYEETKYTASLEGLPVQTFTSNQDTKPGPKPSLDHQMVASDEESSGPVIGVVTVDPPLSTVGRRYINNNIIMRTGRQRLRWSTPTDESLWRLFYLPGLVLIQLPHVLFTGLQWAQGVVWLTLLATIISIVFSAPPYNFDAAQLGYLGIGPMIGNLIGSIYSGVLGDKAVLWLAKRNKGYFEPEFRLYTLIPSIILQAVGLILFGHFLQQRAHWIYPSIGGLLFGFGLGSISDASLTLVIDCYIELTGPSFVAVTFVRNAISIAVPFSITPWMSAMNLQNMFILSGSISFIISGTAIVLIVYGRRIRVKLAPRYYALVERQLRLCM